MDKSTHEDGRGRTISEIFATPGRFLSNIYDPYDPNARMYFTCSFHAWDSGPEAIEIEWQYYMDWVKKNILCPPKATEAYTQKQLIAMGLVALYAPVKSARKRDKITRVQRASEG